MDQYSLLHFASGIIARYWNISLFWWTIVHVLFEWIENTTSMRYFINTYLTMWPGGKPASDSIINSLGDTLFSIIGWILGHSMFILF